jgi:hypothetical protein
VERKAQKILQGYGKPINELIDHLVDLKIAIEDYYNISINQETVISSLCGELKKSNVSYKKKDIDAFSRRMKKREKEARKRWRFFSLSLDIPDNERIDYELSELSIFDKVFKRNANGEQVEEEEELELPAGFVFGVTATLCGIFLYVIPIPGCRKLGESAIALGMGYCIQSVCQKADENAKEERERRKQEPVKQ